MRYIYEYASPMGLLTLASDGDSITGLWVEGQKYHGHALTKNPRKCRVPVFDAAATWLDAYFNGKEPASAPPPLAPQGTPFQRLVWGKLLEIPYGHVTTYGALARSLAHDLHLPSMSARAVGGAVGRNRITVLIPCHRVVGTNGSLTGFAGGIERKKYLLHLEKVDCSSFSLP